MTPEQAYARCPRLAAIVKEMQLLRWEVTQPDMPLLWLERRAIIDALDDGIGGLERARVVLAMARQEREASHMAVTCGAPAAALPGPLAVTCPSHKPAD